MKYNQKRPIRNKTLVFALLFLLAFVLITWATMNHDNPYLMQNFDAQFYAVVAEGITPAHTILAKVFSYAGDYIVMIIISIVFILIKVQNKRRGFLFGLNALFTFSLNSFLKHIFMRERPTINVLTQASGYAFPSGHSMVSAAFYLFAAYVLTTGIKSPRIKALIFPCAIILVLCIAISRVYLGVHYASDVIAGILLGGSLANFYIYLFKKFEDRA